MCVANGIISIFVRIGSRSADARIRLRLTGWSFPYPPAVLENIRFPIIQDLPFSGYSDELTWFPFAAVVEHGTFHVSLRDLEVEDHVPVVVEIFIFVPGDIPDR